MYRYDTIDRTLVEERLAQFEDQVARRMIGALTEDQFKPLRLMNGVYLQLHAYMLRVAVPYGVLSSNQLRTLADIAETYDRGYGHVTTRQNMQFNWPALADIPAILRRLADVEMHAIQTSGNCIRNVTTDAFAGVAADEIADPRIYAELIRQWSTLHPEFTFLPRKFKIAITGSRADRAALLVHDVGIWVTPPTEAGARPTFTVTAGGGQGRTPMLGHRLADAVPEADLLAYLEAILRVYNRYGRRDNKYKARIKILVHEIGIDAFRADVEAEFARIRGGELTVPVAEVERIAAFFEDPAYRPAEQIDGEPVTLRQGIDPHFGRWLAANLNRHRVPGYTSVTVSLKPEVPSPGIEGTAPGDISADQMRALADLADTYGFGELRFSHRQNIVLPDIAEDHLEAVYDRLREIGLAHANVGLLTDIIACPGLDFCALANARSIPIAQSIAEKFSDLERVADLGPISLNISGCINACGHHHVAGIGILGVDRRGEEAYQITLGGEANTTDQRSAAIGKVLGPTLKAEELPDALDRLLSTYLDLRLPQETFLAAVDRLGLNPFKEAVYVAAA